MNFLKHKNKSENGESGCVYYNDGTKKIIDYADINTISKYVSTESSEDVAKNIKHLDLYLDSKFLENNFSRQSRVKWSCRWAQGDYRRAD